jgi:hypothetical protein
MKLAFNVSMGVLFASAMMWTQSGIAAPYYEDPLSSFRYIAQNEYGPANGPVVTEEYQEEVYTNDPNNFEAGDTNANDSNMQDKFAKFRKAVEQLASDADADPAWTALVLATVNIESFGKPQLFELLAKKAHGEDVKLPEDLKRTLHKAFVLDKDGEWAGSVGKIIENATVVDDNGKVALKPEYKINLPRGFQGGQGFPDHSRGVFYPDRSQGDY